MNNNQIQNGNRHQTMYIAIFVLLAVLAVVFHIDRVRDLERDALIQSAISNFWEQRDCPQKQYSRDSMSVKKDTILFYRNGDFMGKTVIETK